MFTRRKMGVPGLKIVSMEPKIWRAVPIFLARVNGVLDRKTLCWDHENYICPKVTKM